MSARKDGKGGKSGRGLVRSLVRKGTRASAKPPVARLTRGLGEPSACRRCGALFAGQVWRRPPAVSHARLARASWTTCPACRQASAGLAYGRVIVAGAYAARHETEIRRRIRNVAERARFTQPQRRVVSAERRGAVLEVLTTSQKLAHRIAHELTKAFRGRARYVWSDRDGSLLAVWRREL